MAVGHAKRENERPKRCAGEIAAGAGEDLRQAARSLNVPARRRRRG